CRTPTGTGSSCSTATGSRTAPTRTGPPPSTPSAAR
ncbi:MAG: hypothetical protein AVDCRST_MAG05-3846, partial [uncultured Rubrobacteraceae bacterium]